MLFKAAALSLVLLSSVADAAEHTVQNGDVGQAQFFCKALDEAAAFAVVVSHKDRFTDDDLKNLGELAVFTGKCVYVPLPAKFTYVGTPTVPEDAAKEIDGYEVWEVKRPDGTTWFTVHKQDSSI